MACGRESGQSDAELIGRWRLGDSCAMAELVRRHNGAVVRYANSIVKDIELARDVAQDVWAKVCEWDDLDVTGRGQFLALLLTMARFRARRACSDRSRRERILRERVAHVGVLSGSAMPASPRAPAPPVVHMARGCGGENGTTDPRKCTCRRRACRVAVDEAWSWLREMERKGMLPEAYRR